MARHPRHRARPGDLICGPILGDGFGWLVLTVSEVDDEGFVAVVLDERGRRVAISRVYAVSTEQTPHLVAPADTLTPEGRRRAVGLCAADLEDIKHSLRAWKAETLQ